MTHGTGQDSAERAVSSQVVLGMRHVRKFFPSSGVLAVDDVSLEVRRGEVLAVIGENGTGKTTLMNILFGLVEADQGTIEVDGTQVTIRNPRTAMALGMGMVHQHFTLVPRFTVAQNVALGAEQTRLTLVDDRAAQQRVEELAGSLGFQIKADARAGELPVGAQQRVEILKALAGEARIVVLDEPTGVLTPPEVDDLIRTLRRLAASGTSVVFISHKLPEVLAVADRIVVMRKGAVVGEAVPGDTDSASLARMMVGREVLLQASPAARDSGPPVLVLDSVSCAPGPNGDAGLHGVDLGLRSGEILGVAGVSGNGQSDLIEVIAGLSAPDEGSITVADRELTGLSPRQVRAAGVAHIAEDRMRVGLNRQATVAENLVATRYHRTPWSRFLLLRRGLARRAATQAIERYSIRGASAERSVASLSGGNLQKVVIARELEDRPRVVLANQPTRGLDVGSIEVVHAALLAARDDGAGVLLVSAELDELLTLSDRVAVMYAGRLHGPYARAELDRESIGRLMAGGDRDGTARGGLDGAQAS